MWEFKGKKIPTFLYSTKLDLVVLVNKPFVKFFAEFYELIGIV